MNSFEFSKIKSINDSVKQNLESKINFNLKDSIMLVNIQNNNHRKIGESCITSNYDMTLQRSNLTTFLLI